MSTGRRSGFRCFSRGALVIVVVSLLAAACDQSPLNLGPLDLSPLDLSPTEPDQRVHLKWDSMFVLSGNLTRSTGEAVAFEPACRLNGEVPDRLSFNVLFQGTQRKDDGSDRDLSIRPGDRLAGRILDEALVTPDLFKLQFSCIEPLPEEDLYACEGTVDPASQLESVGFYSYGKPEVDNEGPLALAILVDMSGSMKGLADPEPPYAEASFTDLAPKLSGVDFAMNATDPGYARLAAVEALVRNMDDDDAVIMLSFNENKVDVVCELPDAPDAALDVKLEDCLSTNRNLILGNAGRAFSALDWIKGEEKGRTPLWHAVDLAYRYMQGDSTVRGNGNGEAIAPPKALTGAAYRHIVVVDDGPDTCAPSSDLNQCSAPCIEYNTSFETLRDHIESQQPEERIPVHFLQMQAKGYPDRDPRQQEIACLTGGQYAFVNTWDISKALLRDVLAETLLRIRYTFRGYWRFVVATPVLAQPGAAKPGYEHVLAGWGWVHPGPDEVLVSNEDGFDFEPGSPDAGGDGPFSDGRIAFRIDCDPLKDACPTDETPGACAQTKWWCDEQTLTCRGAEAWAANGDKSSCADKTVLIRVQVQTTPGTGTQTDIKTVEIAGVPTVCCTGACMPPRPPQVPAEVAKPEGLAVACFYYDEGRGWTHEVSDDPNSKWVYWATLKLGYDVGCTWENLEPHLKYSDTAGLSYPDDWDCGGQNCFPPSVR
ncbi:MAG: hypothetical protein FJ109_11380 [Deltaproteobacteria bacterium]|nr:hypothetical protein [Deltaproteobacteria bacterium]